MSRRTVRYEVDEADVARYRDPCPHFVRGFVGAMADIHREPVRIELVTAAGELVVAYEVDEAAAAAGAERVASRVEAGLVDIATIGAGDDE